MTLNNGNVFKERNIVPKYEDILSFQKEQFAITIAPNDLFQCWNKPERIYDFKCIMQKLLLKISDSAHMVLYGELSPLGRLHVHGLISFKDPLKFYLNYIHTMCEDNTIVIKRITEMEKWEIYIKKQNLFKIETSDTPKYSDSIFIVDQKENALLRRASKKRK